MATNERKPDFKLWDAYYENFEENWPCCNGTALYNVPEMSEFVSIFI